ncbi:DUF4113 domain-containing protein [Paraburkholderia caledonica]|uniref:DUF4113 domain-containing protein n=1 Tax=Paraburkholderia caledonica TaxID=134536 RepID=UPI0038B7A937
MSLADAALHGLNQIYMAGFKYVKAGGILLDMQEQGDLFSPTSSRRDRLMAALDAVNERFGRNTLRVGNVEGWQAWHMSQNAKTPSHTTDWGELPIAPIALVK